MNKYLFCSSNADISIVEENKMMARQRLKEVVKRPEDFNLSVVYDMFGWIVN